MHYLKHSVLGYTHKDLIKACSRGNIEIVQSIVEKYPNFINVYENEVSVVLSRVIML